MSDQDAVERAIDSHPLRRELEDVGYALARAQRALVDLACKFYASGRRAAVADLRAALLDALAGTVRAEVSAEAEDQRRAEARGKEE